MENNYQKQQTKIRRRKLIGFWILSFTWALPTTLLGALVALGLIVTGHKPERFGPICYFRLNVHFGLELGCFFISPKRASYSLKCHELGHHLQACYVYGPVTLFAVCIPSAVRYWLREIKQYEHKKIYSIFLIATLALIGIGVAVVGKVFNLFGVYLLGLFVVFYAAWLGGWLIGDELPRYKSKPYPAYDDFCVESDATARGLEFMQKYFPDEINSLW